MTNGPVVAIDPSPEGGYYALWGPEGLRGVGTVVMGGVDYPEAKTLVIEVPTGRPVWSGGGGMQVLSTAYSAGYIAGVYSSRGARVVEVRPDEWRRWLGLPPSQWGKIKPLRAALERSGIEATTMRGLSPHHLDALALVRYYLDYLLTQGE
ncbi:hypothetical protein MN1_240 [Thermus phage MN1]|nr:hypothetical protein MN1_240 [Thermus phage MN1]